MMKTFWHTILGILLVMMVTTCARQSRVSSSDTSDDALAQHLLAKAGIRKGICSFPQCQNSQLVVT